MLKLQAEVLELGGRGARPRQNRGQRGTEKTGLHPQLPGSRKELSVWVKLGGWSHNCRGWSRGKNRTNIASLVIKCFLHRTSENTPTEGRK